MGAGKTTALKSLEESGEYFGYSFFDLDEEIFELHKHEHNIASLSELINKMGFEWFRETEYKVLNNLINSNDKIWISLGGGTLTNDKSLELLNKIQGYWIKTKLSTCIERIKADDSRPLAILSEDELAELYKSRVKSYERYKDFVLREAE